MSITANDVAVAAIAAGFGGVVLASWNQRALVRGQYVRDHRTETYLQLLQGVNRRQVRIDESFRKGSFGVIPAIPAAEGDDLFSARLLAFGSQAAQDLWHVTGERADEYMAAMEAARALYGAPLAAIPGLLGGPDPGLQLADEKWQEAYEAVVALVRAELKLRPSVLHWRLRARARATRRELEAQQPGTDASPP